MVLNLKRVQARCYKSFRLRVVLPPFCCCAHVLFVFTGELELSYHGMYCLPGVRGSQVQAGLGHIVNIIICCCVLSIQCLLVCL